MIDEQKLIANLDKARYLKERSGVKLVLALKCFSTWGVFDLIKPYLDGTTSSGPYEVKLGHETFGGETHAYSVGYSEADVLEVADICNKMIFNSYHQFEAYQHLVKGQGVVGAAHQPWGELCRTRFSQPGANLFSPWGAKRSAQPIDV